MKNEKTNNLYVYSVEKTWEFILVTVMYAIGSVSFPYKFLSFIFGDCLSGELLSLFFVRILCCIIPLWLMRSVYVKNTIDFKNFFNGIEIIIPFLIVAINNFPIVSLLSGEASLDASLTVLDWLSYLLAVLGGVLLEELCFRGIIFPTLYRKYKYYKNRDFLCVFYSALLFGGVHIVNLFSGANIGGVILQLGYSFLIGGMCAIALLKTGNFLHSVLLHFVYNIGGLLSNYNLISGKVWCFWEVVVTAVIAVIVIFYAVYLIFKNKGERLSENISPN